MQMRIWSLLVFLVSLPAFCQVEPAAEGGFTAPEDYTQMMTPPPVSGISYPNIAGSDMRSNYLAIALTENAGYTDNVLPGETNTPVSDYTYIFNPTLSYDQIRPRQHTSFTYSPGFAFYQPDSVLDSIDQSATFRFEEQLRLNLAFNVTDTFIRTSDIFNESFPFSGGIGGTAQPPIPAVLAPFVQQLGNDGSAAISYQFGPNSMVGAGGRYSLYNFSNPSQALGLYNSSDGSVSAFFDRRFARNQYVGLDYQYSRTVAAPPNAQVVTQAETLLPFYTMYFNHSFSVSVSAGAQDTHVTSPQQATSDSWFPEVAASVGRQGPHTSLALSYLRVITAGEGLVGPYKSSNVSVSGTWQISRNWNAGASAGYGNIDAVTSIAGLDYQGGNSFTAGVTLGHTMGDRFTANLGFDRLHESFSGIPVITANPDSDRVYVTVTYQLRKPLGR